MKKILTLILVLGMILALAACGDTKQADVVESVDPVNNSVVIEPPPATVSGPDTPTETYPAENALPTTAPTTRSAEDTSAASTRPSMPDTTRTGRSRRRTLRSAAASSENMQTSSGRNSRADASIRATSE